MHYSLDDDYKGLPESSAISSLKKQKIIRCEGSYIFLIWKYL